MARQRIGILGGTFDPPHIGHLILAEYTVEALELEQALFVPAADPPHKHLLRMPIEHRLPMLELAIADNPRFVLSRIDVDRPGPHYSADMVRIVQSQFPDAELFFVMGGDSLRDLPNWHRPQDLMQLCKLAVMRRSDEDIQADMHEDVLPGLGERVVMIDAPLLGVWISSTLVIERLDQGRSVRYLVPDSVLEYITENKLYGELQ